MSEPLYRPFVELIFKSNLSIRLAYSEYDSICAAWESKKAFFEGETEYGSVVKVKLSNLIVITQITHEQRLAMIEEKRAQNKEDEVLGTSD